MIHYITDEWFLVTKDNKEFAEMVWRVLKHEYSYMPHLSHEQFCAKGFSEMKVTMLVDLLRLVETHHNRLVDAEVDAAMYKEKKKKWLAGSSTADHDEVRVRTRKITLCLDEDICDESTVLSDIPPATQPPGRPIYRKPVPTAADPVKSPRTLLGGRVVGANEVEDDIDDPVLECAREDHPRYDESVQAGPLIFKRGFAIPDTRVAFVACADGMPLMTTTNKHPPHAKFSDSHAQLAFSYGSAPHSVFDANEPCVITSPPNEPHKDSIRYVKKFPVILERALIKRIRKVAPCTCPLERSEMEQLFAKHFRPPPSEDTQAPRSYWAERSRIMDKLKKQLSQRYPEHRLVFSEEPQYSSAHDSGGEEPQEAEGALTMTLSSKAMTKIERRDCKTYVVPGMEYVHPPVASELQQSLSESMVSLDGDWFGTRDVVDAATETDLIELREVDSGLRSDVDKLSTQITAMQRSLSEQLLSVSSDLQNIHGLIDGGPSRSFQSTADLGASAQLSSSSSQAPIRKRNKKAVDPFPMASLRAARTLAAPPMPKWFNPVNPVG